MESIRYPWDKWFSRKKFRLVRPTHFSCKVHCMAQLIRTKAASRGLRVSIRIGEDSVTVEVKYGHY